MQVCGLLRAAPLKGGSTTSHSRHQFRLQAMSASKAPVQVTGVDHIVLRVKDPVVSVDWYASKLGLEPYRLQEFKQGKAPFPTVRISPTFLIDFMPVNFKPGSKVPESEVANPAAEQLTPGHPKNVDHFCLTVEGDDIEAVRQQLAAIGRSYCSQRLYCLKRGCAVQQFLCRHTVFTQSNSSHFREVESGAQ